MSDAAIEGDVLSTTGEPSSRWTAPGLWLGMIPFFALYRHLKYGDLRSNSALFFLGTLLCLALWSAIDPSHAAVVRRGDRILVRIASTFRVRTITIPLDKIKAVRVVSGWRIHMLVLIRRGAPGVRARWETRKFWSRFGGTSRESMVREGQALAAALGVPLED